MLDERDAQGCPQESPPLIFTLRISLPDRPGMLGRIASAFGKGDVNILTLDVVDREHGLAVDDLRVEAPRGMQQALRTAAQEVPGFAVEFVRPLAAFRHVLEPLELAAALSQALSQGAECALGQLIEHLPDAFGATWAIAVDVRESPPEVLAAGLGAPSAARLPPAWLDLQDLVALRHAGSAEPQVPPRVRSGEGGLEVAAALLDRPTSAVLLGREGGPRFRAAEIRHLGLLARIASSPAGHPGSLLNVP
ncbi:MAG: amino acid-binding protein [Actinomycetota bacterium]